MCTMYDLRMVLYGTLCLPLALGFTYVFYWMAMGDGLERSQGFPRPRADVDISVCGGGAPALGLLTSNISEK